MKLTYLFACTLAAALTGAPSFAQQEQEKAPEAKVHQEDRDSKASEPAKQKSDAKEGSRIPQSDQEPGVKNPEAARQKGQMERHDADHMPQSDQAPGTQGRDEAKRGPGGDRADRHAEYHFRGDEKTKLRASYRDINRVDRSRRVTITREQAIPVDIRTRIEPVPVDVVSYLPPPPPGYIFGFVDGYCVVYDPNTFIVIDVIDLF
jgi:hypothetical protein